MGNILYSDKTSVDLAFFLALYIASEMKEFKMKEKFAKI
jgi:hypothetical protein